MGTNGPKSMMMTGNRGANITGSVPLLPTMMQALKSRVHTSLNDATTTALKSVGGNSSAVAGFIHPENGFLVYNVIVLDANNNIHRVIVDAGNGKVTIFPINVYDEYDDGAWRSRNGNDGSWHGNDGAWRSRNGNDAAWILVMVA